MKASIILSIVVSVLGGAHIVNAQSTNPEPACAVSCFASQPLVGGCTAGDTPCLCSKPTFIESVSSCFTSTCLDNEVWSAIESLLDFCDNVSPSPPPSKRKSTHELMDGWMVGRVRRDGVYRFLVLRRARLR
ncbi:hypothetical protein SISSUDRAFT_254497 [Sistotremastrum suecicum HHB10207 ss-3]|uniref:CFEM domain-containing protein n=1 Tax=Sistotremastrum suecicum HHB10207 ss-3 TaxID=1314776 RepID=A0A165ZVB9_9AGAM|nr:hypothetical protein SISSUDRAFT_254497 [Sistotremastrum suecicum HHB10207 ss-3]